MRTLTAETALTHAADVKQEVNATAPPFTHTFVHHQQNHCTTCDARLTCTRLLPSEANAHVTSPLTVLFTKPEYLLGSQGNINKVAAASLPDAKHSSSGGNRSCTVQCIQGGPHSSRRRP